MRAFFAAIGGEQDLGSIRPIMIMLAGPNGSGKSTLWNRVIKPALGERAKDWDYINADDEVREVIDEYESESPVRLDSLPPDQLVALQLQAQKNTSEQRRRLIFASNPRGFIFETVFSDTGGHKLAELRQGRNNNFKTTAVLVNANNVDTLIDRVNRRKEKGDHGVDPEKQRERYPRVLANMRDSLSVVELIVLVDNSQQNEDETPAFRFVALVKDGVLVASVANLPTWAELVLQQLPPPRDFDLKH